MNQLAAPLFEALLTHTSKKSLSYHVPGHKGGSIFTEKGRAEFKPLLSLDVTELEGLDDLHAPGGPILEAQKLLAELYNVRESYFLVNGSTVGNIAMILATCKEGDTVLVQRNCHKSILHGLMLANVRPVFLSPTFHEEWGVAGGIESWVVGDALTHYPDATAVILTYPNYYGMGYDLSSIAELVHEKGIPLLVDEAHGAHLTLAPPFLDSSLANGADIVVHSAHKTLPAMTMGSYLHVNSELIDLNKVRFYLQMLQSSSPSYPIMASLDLARSYLASFTEEDKISLLEKIRHFRKQINGLNGLKVLQTDQLDPLKVTISAEGKITGFQLQKMLENKGIYTELADTQNVLLVMPLLKEGMDDPFTETVQRIREATEGVNALTSLPADRRGPVYDPSDSFTGLQLSYSEMKEKQKFLVPLKESPGCVAAEMIIPYPPGIPFVMMGEVIEVQKVKQLEELLEKGTRFHGGSKLLSRKVWVFE